MQEALTRDIDRIVRMTDRRAMIGLSSHPAQGQFVVTGMQPWATTRLSMVGFCVQVRVGFGQFGSDMIFLRHADGSLTTHENQCFYALSEDQVALARRVFVMLPEDEDYGHGYRCANKVHEVGFVITGSRSPAAPVKAGMAIRVELAGHDGESATQYIAIV